MRDSEEMTERTTN